MACIYSESLTNPEQVVLVIAVAEVEREEAVGLPEGDLEVDEEALVEGEAVRRVGHLTSLCHFLTKNSSSQEAQRL